MSQLTKFYLFFYNSLQFFGWAISLSRILINFFSTKSVHGAYSSAGELICYLQILEFMEVIHGAIVVLKELGLKNVILVMMCGQFIGWLVGEVNTLIAFLFWTDTLITSLHFTGIVPTGALLPLMQWGGKTYFLFAIVRRINEVQELPSVFITFVPWSLIGVIRYPYYALNCFGICPSFITYLRYTAFIVLYPIGVGPGEIWLMYQALPFIKKKNLYADTFASLPFSFYNFVTVVLIFYPFFWLKLYLHLFKQRRSKLNKPHKKKKN